MKHSFKTMLKVITDAYTGRSLRNMIYRMGMTPPADVTGMYLRGDPKEYILAAALACSSVGA